jgi:hypothetical protein
MDNHPSRRAAATATLRQLLTIIETILTRIIARSRILRHHENIRLRFNYEPMLRIRPRIKQGLTHPVPRKKETVTGLRIHGHFSSLFAVPSF